MGSLRVGVMNHTEKKKRVWITMYLTNMLLDEGPVALLQKYHPTQLSLVKQNLVL